MDTLFSQPTHTFQNLPSDKQQAITGAAVMEFAAKGYKRASVNAIVSSVGIAKGSLYQYFNNKESIFLHTFDQLTELIKQTVKESASGNVAENFFHHVEQVFAAGISFIEKHPMYYQLYLRTLFEHDIPRREELLSRVRLFSTDYFAPLCDHAKEKGQIRADISTAFIIFILDGLIDRFLQAVALPYLDCGLTLHNLSAEDLQQTAHNLLQTLKLGLLPQ